jgi:Ca-activated chloride channel family protein
VLYENLVIESYGKGKAQQPLVAIYPTEGTFWSDHPYAILDAPWVGADERSAAEAFQTFLKDRPAQERAMELGFRPADPKITIAAPIDAAHGVDPKQPQTLLPLPDAKVLERLLQVWNETKKGADVLFVFDKSGSMRGRPLQEAKGGAKAFVKALADRDEVTLLFFDNQVYPPVGPNKLATQRETINGRIDMTIADGGTALYDAIAQAYDVALGRAKTQPNQIHAVVVMTDGKDENSKMTLDQLKAKFPKEEGTAGFGVKVFTIAYGAQAEGQILADIAEAAKGSSAKGSVDTIKDVYLEMASFF